MAVPPLAAKAVSIRVSSGLVFCRPATRGGGHFGGGGPGIGRQCSQVADCVAITIDRQPAGIACEHSLGQAQLGFHHATSRAGLGTWVEPVGHQHATASPIGLVLQLPPHLCPCRRRDPARQATVTEHPGNVQVFDHDGPEAFRQRTGQPVQRVGSLIGDLCVLSTDVIARAAPSSRRDGTGPPVRADPPRSLPL